MNRKHWRLIAFLGVILLLLSVRVGLPIGQVEAGAPPQPEVKLLNNHGISSPLRDIPPIPPVVGEVRELPRKTLPNRLGSSGTSGIHPALQFPTVGAGAAATLTNFEGVNQCRRRPPAGHER